MKDDKNKSIYHVDAWGEDYSVDPEKCEIKLSHGSKPANLETSLVILFYLLKAKDKLVKNEWISEKDIPGGLIFFTGPHEIPLYLIADRFGNDLQGFKNVCLKLGGEPIDMADAAFQFRVTRRVPVTILIWKGDEEFQPESKILFDRTISDHFPLDVIFALSREICDRISSQSC